MAVLMLEIRHVKDKLPDFCVEYNPSKIYFTGDICCAIGHLATKFEGIEYECKKVYGSEGVYVTLMEKSNYKYIPQIFLSEFCMKEYFRENSKMFVKSVEDELFDVRSFSRCSYMKRFF